MTRIPLIAGLLAGASFFPASAQLDSVHHELAFEDLGLQMPTGMRISEDDVFYVSEYDGRIRAFENSEGTSSSTVFLDISDRITQGQPRGEFYSLALHPDFSENGYVYVVYLTSDASRPSPLQTTVSRFTRSADDPTRADPESELPLLVLDQPAYSHSGDDIAFGPDGYLYIPLGDGGTYLDAGGHAQDPSTLLGSVLRIDVDNPSNGLNYGIPPDNPFVGNTLGWREEVYAYGFRNPWRLTFDRLTGDVWVGDVGEQTFEEINRVVAGANYGWPIMEGAFCFPSTEPQDCDVDSFALPVHAYRHDLNGGYGSVNGGYVYRGSAIPELYGYYVFADYMSRKVWALDPFNPEDVTLLFDGTDPDTIFGAFVSFAEDREGELYFAELFHGRVWQLRSSLTDSTESGAEPSSELSARPNPAREQTTVFYQNSTADFVRVALYDVLGREVAVLYDGPLQTARSLTLSVPTSGLPAGLYVCRVEAEGSMESIRITVLD